MDEKCPTCDGPYCPPARCAGREGFVWVKGRGWRAPHVVRAARVLTPTLVADFTDVWTAERFGVAEQVSL